jgi:upstream activation factor subunit UAF30
MLIAEDSLDEGPRKIFDMVTTDYGVDVKAVQAGVKSKMKAEAADRAEVAKPAAKTPAATKPAASGSKRRTPNQAFMQPLHCSPALQAIVGTEPMPRTEIVSTLWAYIKKHKLQDKVNKRMVTCDVKLQAIFKKKVVSMFEMAGLIGKDIGPRPFATTAAPGPIKTKGKKTTPAQAKAGISTALAAAEGKDVCEAAIGCRVRITGGAKANVGRQGILGPYMGDVWKVDFVVDLPGAKLLKGAALSARVNRKDFVVVAAPAKYELKPEAAWPFPTAVKAQSKAAAK